MKKIVPNALTSLNLVFGVFAIIAVLGGNFDHAAYYIVGAVIADSLDGRAARYYGVSGEFGKELDSLCDLGSFGVAPAIIAYALLLKDFGWIGYFSAGMFAVCVALRLARFNVNTSTVKGYFMGLPSPAGGALIATFCMLDLRQMGLWFAVVVIAVAYLMISEVKYPDFKGKDGEKIYSVAVVLTLATGFGILYFITNSYLFVPIFCYTLFGLLNSTFSSLFGARLSRENQ